ncbi:Hypothetical protein SMAX5B_004909 [Scophthalmus maximus]|uniref:Uncharacterized protein n=1 Tax=Scophthalmus maximus TaxID=52904 RepID=A0A2U9BSC2_SCOMX|nr:Hypothetical protein SMAX5B_004909 [Scophthalmus maximus]
MISPLSSSPPPSQFLPGPLHLPLDYAIDFRTQAWLSNGTSQPRRIQARRRERSSDQRPANCPSALTPAAISPCRPTYEGVRAHADQPGQSHPRGERERRCVGNLCLYCGQVIHKPDGVIPGSSSLPAKVSFLGH